jgi:hypothetical protein
MMRFTLVVVLIAAVQAATECQPGTTGFTTCRLVPIQLRGGYDCGGGCCGCHVIAEFRFRDIQGNQIAPVSATNPGGYQGGVDYHFPSRLIDQDTATTFLDHNVQPVEFEFSPGVSVTSYEWVTGPDASARDMISWRLEGKQFSTDTAWTTVHTVSNYGTTESRKSVVGPFNVTSWCSECPTGTYKNVSGEYGVLSCCCLSNASALAVSCNLQRCTDFLAATCQ